MTKYSDDPKIRCLIQLVDSIISGEDLKEQAGGLY